MSAYLAFHLDRLTGRPSAARFADELDELASAVREALPGSATSVPGFSGSANRTAMRIEK
jgi:hypothetical protein